MAAKKKVSVTFSIIKKSVFALYCFVAAIGLIELAFIAFNIDPESPFDVIQLNVSGELLGEYDENLFWRLKDVQPEFSAKATEKIMCLTDSVAVMYQGKGYPDLLQRYLSTQFPNKSLEVFNGGVPGYTSFQGLKYFSTELLPHQPDLVILCYGWNDHWQSNNGLPDKLQKTIALNFLARLDFLRSVRFVYAKTLEKGQRKYDKMRGHTLRVSIEDYRSNIQSFVELCGLHHIKLILMTAPYYQLPDELLQLHGAYNDVVREIARTEKLPLIDRVADFKDKKSLFLEPDTDPVHYNWEGNKIIAGALAEKIPEILTF